MQVDGWQAVVVLERSDKSAPGAKHDVQCVFCLHPCRVEVENVRDIFLTGGCVMCNVCRDEKTAEHPEAFRRAGFG